MITKAGLVRWLVMGGSLLVLMGCYAANLQGEPRLVGVQEGKSLYSIGGYTNWGEQDPNDAMKYAVKYAEATCKTAPTIVRVTTQHPATWGATDLLWTAIYTCDQPKK